MTFFSDPAAIEQEGAERTEKMLLFLDSPLSAVAISPAMVGHEFRLADLKGPGTGEALDLFSVFSVISCSILLNVFYLRTLR
jgi:hypothetical protein